MNDQEDSKEIRKSGLKKIGIGVIGSVSAWYLFQMIFPSFNIEGRFTLLIILCFPSAYALAGILEIISGVQFWKISQKWNDLKGWQRGVLGIVVAFTCMFLFGFVGLSWMEISSSR